MVRSLLTSLILIPVAFLAACAQGPDSIAPVPMPTSMFASMSCDQARAAHATATAEQNALEAKQRGAVTGDAIGVFLIGVPVASLTGGNKAGDLGTSKGKVLALEGRLQSC